MTTPNGEKYARDAQTAMRSAARLVLQGKAAGLSDKEILAELDDQGIALPDAEGFVNTVTNAAQGPTGDIPRQRSRSLRFGIGLISTLVVSLGIYWLFTLGN